METTIKEFGDRLIEMYGPDAEVQEAIIYLVDGRAYRKMPLVNRHLDHIQGESQILDEMATQQGKLEL